MTRSSDFDQNGDEISDGDSAQDGLQIDLNEGITAVKVAVTSPDGRVTRSYTVFFRQPTFLRHGWRCA